MVGITESMEPSAEEIGRKYIEANRAAYGNSIASVLKVTYRKGWFYIATLAWPDFRAYRRAYRRKDILAEIDLILSRKGAPKS